MSTNIGPAYRGVAVTPSDSANIEPTRGIYVGVSGDLVATMRDGNDVTFVGLAAGVIHPIQAIKIKSTGTTATSIRALY